MDKELVFKIIKLVTFIAAIICLIIGGFFCVNYLMCKRENGSAFVLWKRDDKKLSSDDYYKINDGNKNDDYVLDDVDEEEPVNEDNENKEDNQVEDNKNNQENSGSGDKNNTSNNSNNNTNNNNNNNESNNNNGGSSNNKPVDNNQGSGSITDNDDKNNNKPDVPASGGDNSETKPEEKPTPEPEPEPEPKPDPKPENKKIEFSCTIKNKDVHTVLVDDVYEGYAMTDDRHIHELKVTRIVKYKELIDKAGDKAAMMNKIEKYFHGPDRETPMIKLKFDKLEDKNGVYYIYFKTNPKEIINLPLFDYDNLIGELKGEGATCTIK